MKLTYNDSVGIGLVNQKALGEILKRLFDLVSGLLGLAFLAPLLCAIALTVRLDSVGPVFYRGRRTGRYGGVFRIFKFRTMVVDAEQKGGLSTGMNDHRITRVGRFLRRYKLDELPQLLNVLKGEMSVVGPRPEMVEYTRLYSPEEQVILTVRPGITDYASLEFIRLDEALGAEDPDTVYEQRVRPIKNALRVKYAMVHTFWRDMDIILETLLRLAGITRWSTGH